jgi:vancomycin resistance protein VanW
VKQARFLHFRRRLGRIFYTWKRRLEWSIGTKKFAKTKADPLQQLVFQHHSLLLRPLKGVDMYLQHNKITNLHIAADSINGLLIQPGETFSFWWLVGKPSARRGFLEGLVLENGRIGKSIGGGLCQLGNLLYWMALHSPLTVTERWRHSYDVFPDVGRTLPFGSGATLAWNYIDLQLKNETPEPFQVCVWLSETQLHGEIRCANAPSVHYEIIEKDHRIQHESWGGYSRHNRLIRRILDAQSARLLHEETVTENHALLMYQPFIGTGK